MTAKNQKQNSESKLAIKGLVKGIPCTKPASSASDERKAAYKKWQQDVKEQTVEHEGKVKGPCRLTVTFYLPKDRYEYQLATANYGPDLDNLAKAFLDGLKKTVLNAVGCDGDACIMSLELSKVKVNSAKEAGAEFLFSSVPGHTIKKVEVVAIPKLNLGVKHWKNPMQKITADTGVYIDNLPGVSHNKGFPPGYDWKQEVGKVVYGAETQKIHGHHWLNKSTP